MPWLVFANDDVRAYAYESQAAWRRRAAHLDATLPERHRRVLTTLIREAAETHHARAALGADAEARYESRKHEGANDTARRNRDAWTRSMFPEAPRTTTRCSG